MRESPVTRESAQLVETMRQRACARWPASWCPNEAFAQYLLERQPSSPAEITAWQEQASDLYLACACLCGHDQAVSELSRICASVVTEKLGASMRLSAVQQSEVHAELEKQLLVGSDRHAMQKLVSYVGQSTLLDWLFVVATRIALNLVRKPSKIDEQLFKAVLGQSPNPELALIKELSYPVLRSAFSAALAKLPLRDRLMLKFYFVDKLSQVAIGRVLGCGHAAVSERIWALAPRIANECRAQLEMQGVSPQETRSFVHLLQSRLRVSLPALFEEAIKAPPTV